MLCDTCRYSDDEGHCGKGRALTDDGCNGYIHGEKAEVPETLPMWMLYLLNSERILLDGMSFTVKGMLEDGCNIDIPEAGHCYHRPVKYTFFLLPGEVGYSILSRSITDHIYMMQWGPCRLSIDTQYTTIRYRGSNGPIVICMSFHHLHRYASVDLSKQPEYEQTDMGSYVWWLDPQAPKAHVDLFLEGLVRLHDMHYWFRETGAYYKPLPLTEPLPSLMAEPPVYEGQVSLLSPTGVCTFVPPHGTGYRYHESTHRRLVDAYMKGTKDFPKLPLPVACDYHKHWRDVIEIYSYNLL